MKMNEILTRIILYPENTLSETIKKLNDYDLQMIILTNKKNTLIATITDGDIRKGLIIGINLNDKIVKVANLNPKYVYSNANINDVFNLFNNYGYKALQLVDEEKNKKLGIFPLH